MRLFCLGRKPGSPRGGGETPAAAAAGQWGERSALIGRTGAQIATPPPLPPRANPSCACTCTSLYSDWDMLCRVVDSDTSLKFLHWDNYLISSEVSQLHQSSISISHQSIVSVGRGRSASKLRFVVTRPEINGIVLDELGEGGRVAGESETGRILASSCVGVFNRCGQKGSTLRWRTQGH